MKFKHLTYFVLGTLIAGGLASCGSSSSDKDKNSSEFKEAEESLKEQIEELTAGGMEKEEAKKKMDSGSKLSLEELKLLFGD